MRTYRHTNPTTTADRRGIREARIEARRRLGGTHRDDAAAIRDIFRREIGTSVRSASPFLHAFVATERESVDGLVERIAPAPRWPRAPALSTRPISLFRRPREPYREFMVSTATGDRRVVRRRGYGHGMLFMWRDGDWACLDVIDHSLEIEARIGSAKIETLFGVLRIELDVAIPDTLAMASVGRSVGEAVDHPALRSGDWPITGIEDPPTPSLGQTLVVETGSKPFRMPWAR